MIRLAASAAILAGIAQLVLFLADGAGLGERFLIASWNLLLIPVALILLAWLGSRARVIVVLATLAGLASLSMWAGSAIWPQLGLPELGWIGTSAAWWVAIGVVIYSERRLLGILTIVVGIAGIGDFLVTVPESVGAPLPVLVFMLAGGWKIPLAIVWSVAIGVSLAARPPALWGDRGSDAPVRGAAIR